MLKSVKLVNYSCFRDTSVNLGAMTALVGPNASGKTALLRALTSQSFGREDLWQRRLGNHGKISWTLHDGQNVIATEGHTAKEIYSSCYIRFDVTRMRNACQVQEAEALRPSGDNLTNVVATLSRPVQTKLAEQLAALIPVISDYQAKPSNAGQHRLVFQDRWNQNLWYEPNQVSDGTILTLGLLALQHQRDRPQLLAIEEPEHGLHPHLLENIVGVLRRMSTGEVGPAPVQIVLATQSSELLEYLEPEEVRFLNRDSSDGSVTIEEAATDNENWRQAYEEYQSLGGMWLSGSLGGVPVAEMIRVVLYAEGAGETGDVIALPPASGTALPEQQLGAGHVLLRRAITAEKGLKQEDIRFDAPLRKQRGARPTGSDLHHCPTLRKLLLWASPQLQPHLVVVLVDADGETQRKTTLERCTEKIRVPLVIAVAVQEFEAWLVADTTTVTEMFGEVPAAVNTSEPEKLDRRVAKQGLASWLAGEADASSARRCIAKKCDLDTVARACSSFAAFRRELRAVSS